MGQTERGQRQTIPPVGEHRRSRTKPRSSGAAATATTRRWSSPAGPPARPWLSEQSIKSKY